VRGGTHWSPQRVRLYPVPATTKKLAQVSPPVMQSPTTSGVVPEAHEPLADLDLLQYSLGALNLINLSW
jgi:hypothetical protein